MSNLQKLRDHLDADPEARGYAGMTDLDAAASINLVDIPVEADATKKEFMGAIKKAHWPVGDGTAVADAKALSDLFYILCCCVADGAPLNEFEVRDKLTGAGTNTLFGPGIPNTAPTRNNLEALWASVVSPRQKYQLGQVQEGTVNQARAL